MRDPDSMNLNHSYILQEPELLAQGPVETRSSRRPGCSRAAAEGYANYTDPPAIDGTSKISSPS